MVLLLVT